MAPRDALTDVLDLLRVRGALMAHVRASAPWGLRLSRASGATFHAVMAGACWVRVPGRAPRELRSGDVVLLPTGTGHVIASGASGPARAWDRVAKAQARTATGEIILAGSGTSTQLICASYDYDRNVVHPLVSLLPPVLFITTGDGSRGAAVRDTLRLVHHELMTPSAGAAVVLDRLIDILFVHVIRAWVDNQRDDDRSWLVALRNPSIARALALMHADPGIRWTIDLLARETNVSRATLTRQFARLVGEAPLAYLTRWRMELAARQLRESDDPVAAIAHRVGYASEFAFSRAFSRFRGQAPGRYRVAIRMAE